MLSMYPACSHQALGRSFSGSFRSSGNLLLCAQFKVPYVRYPVLAMPGPSVCFPLCLSLVVAHLRSPILYTSVKLSIRTLRRALLAFTDTLPIHTERPVKLVCAAPESCVPLYLVTCDLPSCYILWHTKSRSHLSLTGHDFCRMLIADLLSGIKSLPVFYTPPPAACLA